MTFGRIGVALDVPDPFLLSSAMRFLGLVLAFVVFASAAAAKMPLPTFAEKDPYPAVRARLLAQGYAPLPNRGQNFSDCEDHSEMCLRFPELTGCIDNAGSDCGYLWKTPDGDYIMLIADSCCEHWVQPAKPLSEEDAKAILAPPSQEFPRISRKLRYSQVRSRLIALGYIPQRITSDVRKEACIYAYKAICRRYPELEDCGNKFCTFIYRRRSDDNLVVVRTRSEGFGFYEMYFPDPDAIHDELIRPPSTRR